MRSPFAIFRKHQKVLMVVLTGLAMFAFVVLDSLQKNPSPELTIPVLAAAALAAAFAWFGRKTGETVKYAVVGAAVGVAIGILIARSTPGPRAPVETAMGNLSHDDIHNLSVRRQNANNFLRLAFEKVAPPRGDNQFMARLWDQQLSSRLFGFGRGTEDPTEDVILDFLLEKEADEMGIVVSDGAISDYINRTANKKLTLADSTSILKTLNLSESQLFDDIRGELRAKLAMEMLFPRATPTPEQYWEDYRKLGVTETLDVANVPVEDFVAEAPTPTPDQVAIFFDAWKERPPMFAGGPGLRQPRRVRIEYLEADAVAVSKEMAAKPVTDQEIKKYYDDHHEDFRNRPTDNVPPLPTGPTINFPEMKDLLLPNEPAGDTKGGAKTPGATQPGATAPSTSGPATSAPATPAKPAPARGGEKNVPAAPAKGGAKVPGKSGASLERDRRRSSDRESPFAETVWDGAPLEFVAYQPAAKQPAAVHEKNPTAVREPDAPSLPERKTASPGRPTTTGAAPTGAKQAGPRLPNAAQPFGPVLPKSVQPGAAAKTGQPAGPQPEFRPLDESLKKEIRERIIQGRALEAIKAKTQAATELMQSLREQLIPAELGGQPKTSPQERKRILTDYAAKMKLKYVVTPLLSFQELQEQAEKYPIAMAAEPMDDPFQQRQPMGVLQTLYISAPENLYQPFLAEDREMRRFAYWKVEDVAEHVPTIEEPGVREQAIHGWKTSEFALKKAKERADELAEIVRKSKKPMAEALVNQTVTKKGPKVTVIPTIPFSWYTVPSAPPQGLENDTAPRLSEITGVKDVDDAFMKTVFDEMHVGDVRVVPNRGPTVQSVVQVKNRHPANEAEMAGFRARFMKENLFSGGSMFGGHSPYEYLNMPEQQQVVSEWADRLHLKYNVRRNADEERRGPRTRRVQGRGPLRTAGR